MNKLKDKKKLIPLVVFFLTIIGGVFALFESNDTFTNSFIATSYGTEVEETFYAQEIGCQEMKQKKQ